ncbi:hypothetical protein GEMRC1_006207 [Eukaryota sp. GEM-RC1]
MIVQNQPHFNGSFNIPETSSLELFNVEVSFSDLKDRPLVSDPTLVLYFDWSVNSKIYDYSGNYNQIISSSDIDWKLDSSGGFYEFSKDSSTLNIPNRLGRHGWRDSTFVAKIWLDSGGFGVLTDYYNNRCRLGVSVDLNRFYWAQDSQTVVFPRHQWISLIVSISGTTASFYINGVIRASSSRWYNCDNPSSFFPLGALWDMSSPHTQYRGKFREVRIYSRALTFQEVQELVEFSDNRLILPGAGRVSMFSSKMFVITPHFHGHLTVDSLFIFQNFVNFTSPLTFSHHPSFMKHLAFGQNDCPTINLNTDLHVDKLDWYCGSIEGVGHFNVSQLNFYSNGTKTLDITSNFTVFDEIITDSSQTLFFIKTSLHFPQDVEVRCAPNSDFKLYSLNDHNSFLYNIASMFLIVNLPSST